MTKEEPWIEKLKRAKPWLEPAVYVECPYCDKTILIESDMSASLPDNDETMQCEECLEFFVIEGIRSRLNTRQGD